MYESPIKVIYNDVVEEFENEVLKAVQQVDITVDKEELIKALAYDRDSYRRGYKDGITHQNEVWTMRWNEVMRLTPWAVDKMIRGDDDESL